ncbi:response regulator transcription factor [Xanthobacter autotrophicus DSM 431]|uniref:LytR/AlgR family response regulator transcription factor n=1 Tax=Xanthobacter nonsaccharivorans TaxID=3119912 RepID=UPI00372BEED0
MTGAGVLVVDDEPLARRRLVRMLSKLDWIGPVGEAKDAAEALRSIAANEPDILLLDIQMPGGSGFDVLERLGSRAPVVVFVTAFDHHALRAFEANAVDYVTKPVEPARFARALERARLALEGRTQADRLAELAETVAALKSALEHKPPLKREFWVKVRGEYQRLALDSIVWFQSERDYVRIHVAGAAHLYQDSLAGIERGLDGDAFIRIHRGAIVRRSAIVRLRPAPFGALIAVLSDGSEVRVGRTFGPSVRARLLKT